MVQRSIEVYPVQLGRISRDPEAFAALRSIVRELRLAGLATGTRIENSESPLPPLLRLSRGSELTLEEAKLSLGDHRLVALKNVGALTIDDDLVVPGFAIRFAMGVAVIVPIHQVDDADMVYIGVEAPWLMRLAWRVGPPGGIAADLATGTGILAAVLSARYERVVACDLLVAAVECADLTLALNRTELSSTVACVADVAGGLRPGVFDLVVANPPWVPAWIDPTDTNYVYADGGSTGMELPARFLSEAADLLAPGGVAVILVCDTRWRDGSRPLDDQIRLLEARGMEVTIEPAPASAWSTADTEYLLTRRPDCVDGQLVAVVFRRPLHHHAPLG